ncbi:ankyrin repeat-containing domain protein [Lentinula raphanica]|nr:ankyrin repeat-containing domain protein [Lentinula raphanica]
MSNQMDNQSYVDQQFRSDGMFYSAHNFEIYGSNFSVVQGNSLVYYYLINQKEEKPEEWLVAPNCSINYDTASKNQVPETGKWILEDTTYLNWKRNRDILWIEGKAGSGKTYLSTSIIKSLTEANDPSVIVAYHYFDIRDNSRAQTSYRGFLLFLLMQLGAHDEKIQSELNKLTEALDHGFTSSKLSNPEVVTTLLNIAKDLIQQKKQIHIIIDALDECEDIRLVLDFVAEIAKLGSVGVIISSRTRPQDCKFFTISLTDNKMVIGDIAKYIDYGSAKLPLESIRHVRTLLMEKANEGHKKVQLAHASVKEFLLEIQDDHQMQHSIRVNAQLAHQIMAHMCLLYLLHQDEYEDITPPNQADTGLDSITFAQYATQFWAEHNYHSEGADILHTDKSAPVQNFLSENSQSFLNWKKNYNYIGKRTPTGGRIFMDCTPLHVAAFFGLKESIHSLFQKKATKKSKSHQESSSVFLQHSLDIDMSSKILGTAIQAAASGGHKETIEILLQYGADINSQGGYYGTALQVAAICGKKDIVELLLQCGANINAQRGLYGTALHAAAFEALHAAVSEGYNDTIELLLEYGADVNAQKEDHETALQVAVSRGHTHIVSLLLEHGANVNALRGYYGTALNTAVIKGYRDIISILLQHGADVNIQEEHYGTALHQAVSKGHKDIIRLLVKKGANIDARVDNKTALQIAISRGDNDIVKLLLDCSADVNA